MAHDDRNCHSTSGASRGRDVQPGLSAPWRRAFGAGLSSPHAASIVFAMAVWTVLGVAIPPGGSRTPGSQESHQWGQIAIALKHTGLRLPEAVAVRGLWGTEIFGKQVSDS